MLHSIIQGGFHGLFSVPLNTDAKTQSRPELPLVYNVVCEALGLGVAVSTKQFARVVRSEEKDYS